MQTKNHYRPKPAKGKQYKISNWKEYNQALKQRGSIEIWIDGNMESNWYYKGKTQRGAQYQYSDACIEMVAALRAVYHLPYRQLEGFMGSLVECMGWDVQVPDYTAINRRIKKLAITITDSIRGHQEKKYIVIDSTGLKVYGEGEWKVRQHGWGKHRTWMKMHITVDERTGIIESCAMTRNSVDDAAMADPLLNEVAGEVEKLGGDGGYDKNKVYAFVEKRNIQPIIPPQKRARIHKHGNNGGTPLARDQNIRAIRKMGRKKWKEKNNYHRRSKAETEMYRYKTIFGDKLKSRIPEQQAVEVKIKCKLLNKMTQLGRLKTYVEAKIA